MKKIDLKCLSCGANMQVSDDKTEVTCPYCGYKFLLEKEPDINELSQREEKLSYARKTGERKAIEDSISRQRKKKILIVIIIILVLIVCFIYMYYSREYIDDPFRCISVEFDGVDGNGDVKIVDNKECEFFGDIEYISSNKDKLKENEKIKIYASSSKYRFGVSSREYTVSGLSMYLMDLGDLTDEILIKLHDFSYNYIINHNFGITFTGEVENLVPYKLYLYTNNQNKNVLYDVYKADIKTPTGNIYEKYVVAYYENVILLDNSELFSYSKLYHCGNVIAGGDSNAFDKNYVGCLFGYETIIDFESYLNRNNDGTFEIKEK